MVKNFINKKISKFENKSSVRAKTKTYTLLAIISVFINLFLFLGKFLAGVLTASVSILADSFNNLGDAINAAASIVAYFFASFGADEDHPFGHGRIEWIIAVIVSFLVIITGSKLFLISLDAINSKSIARPDLFALFFMVLSIIIKIYIVSYTKYFSKKLNSHSLKAIAHDAMADILTSAAVLLSVVLKMVFDIEVDAICGLIISSFIIFTGFKSIVDIVNEFLGTYVSKEAKDRITEYIKARGENITIHDLFIHDYGYENLYASMHIEVPYGFPDDKLKNIISDTNYKLFKDYGYRIAIQSDYTLRNKDEIDFIKSKLDKTLSEINPLIKIKDFRLVKTINNLNIEFDLQMPARLNHLEDKIKLETDKSMRELDATYRCMPLFRYNKIRFSKFTKKASK